MQISNQLVTWQQLNAFTYVVLVKTTCWGSNWASEWVRTAISLWIWNTKFLLSKTRKLVLQFAQARQNWTIDWTKTAWSHDWVNIHMVNIYSECDHQFTVLKCPSVTRSWPKIAPLGCAGRADSHYRCAGRTNLQWPDDFTSIWTKIFDETLLNLCHEELMEFFMEEIKYQHNKYCCSLSLFY